MNGTSQCENCGERIDGEPAVTRRFEGYDETVIIHLCKNCSGDPGREF